MSDFIINNGVLEKYTGEGGDVVIPDGVTTIENGAFEWCTSLTSITISEGFRKAIENPFFIDMAEGAEVHYI